MRGVYNQSNKLRLPPYSEVTRRCEGMLVATMILRNMQLPGARGRSREG